MPVSPSQVGAIIPCHNEAHRLGDVIRGLLGVVLRVLVVDDGSSDSSDSIARAAGAEVRRNPTRRGKGAALATGWSAAATYGWEWVLFLDGDGQHCPEDAQKFLEAAGGEIRLVIGNRMDQVDAMPWLRAATNRALSRRVSQLAGQPLPDSQCGFRLVHLPTLLGLHLSSQQFEIESEMCVAFARAGCGIRFVPIQVRYGSERSKIRPIADAWRWWRWYQRTRKEIEAA
ncbi:MAG TPA: glycosyltransferase family 2 protein [Verrucomicrobiota bacterium]|nr:glycosyltransferase family 2 protein [Verrucomicrobiota bacterium]